MGSIRFWPIKIDLPLSMFSLAKTVFISLFSESTLLAGETNIVVLEEEILEEENHTSNRFDQKHISKS